MKKKILVLAAAFMLMFSLAGQALAYFEANSGDLIRIVYDKGGTLEVATDLGPLASLLTAPTTANYKLTANPFALSDFGSSATWDNLNVVYFMKTTNAGNNAWTSGDQGGQTVKQGAAWNAFSGYASAVSALYFKASDPLGSSAKVSALQSNPDSYWKRMDFGTGLPAGSLGGFIPAAFPNYAEKNLAALATPGSYVDQYIYYYGGISALSSANKTGVQVALIRTWADGTTEINPSAVPIPAAVYLLGSGLLGLVGIRRKTAAV